MYIEFAQVLRVLSPSQGGGFCGKRMCLSKLYIVRRLALGDCPFKKVYKHYFILFTITCTYLRDVPGVRALYISKSHVQVITWDESTIRIFLLLYYMYILHGYLFTL